MRPAPYPHPCPSATKLTSLGKKALIGSGCTLSQSGTGPYKRFCLRRGSAAFEGLSPPRGTIHMGIIDNLPGLFSSDMAIDLGTANTLVYVKGKGRYS